MKFHSLIVLSCLIALRAFAASEPVYSSYYVENLNLETMRQLNETFDVERRSGVGYEVIVRQERAGDLLKIVPSAKLVEKDINDAFRRLDRTNPGWKDRLRNFESVLKEMNQIGQTYPEIAFVEDYGKDEQNRTLRTLRLTNKTTFNPEKPEIMITSATHGDEVMTVEVVMDFVQSMVKGYATDGRIRKMIDEHVIHFIPVVCPHGYVNHTRSCQGLDPNRDYPYPSQPDHHSIAAIRLETEWFAKRKIAGSLDVHSNLSTVMYPWAYTSAAPAQEDIPRFKDIGKKMAQDTGYNFGQIAQVFGMARGSSADYWYWKGKTLAFGYEIGGGLFDFEGVRDRSARDHEAFRHFIEYF